MPAGNCKLQTLRQYYRLEGGGAHTALGDVETVVSLMADILRPLADRWGLDTWDKILEFTEAPYFPSRLTFGDYKGRDYRDAIEDEKFRSYLEQLASSKNSRTSKVARWYLERLELATSATTRPLSEGPNLNTSQNSVLLEEAIEALRDRLAELQSEYISESANVAFIRSEIFLLTRDHYERRDRLKLIVDYRERFLQDLLQQGREVADELENVFVIETATLKDDYEDARGIAENSRAIDRAQEERLQHLWKRLVKLFHPDRFQNDPKKKDSYEKLVGEINAARDAGDLELLAQISKDPEAYMLARGWLELELDDDVSSTQMQKLHDSLQLEIVEAIERLDQLRDSPDYELYRLSKASESFIAEVAEARIAALLIEIEKLEVKAEQLRMEIAELDFEAGKQIQ